MSILLSAMSFTGACICPGIHGRSKTSFMLHACCTTPIAFMFLQFSTSQHLLSHTEAQFRDTRFQEAVISGQLCRIVYKNAHPMRCIWSHCHMTSKLAQWNLVRIFTARGIVLTFLSLKSEFNKAWQSPLPCKIREPCLLLTIRTLHLETAASCTTSNRRCITLPVDTRADMKTACSCTVYHKFCYNSLY
jgi:hypothetical protein